jgi:predicted  nucleic acid-binding Zn-ribbon protein
VSASVEATNAAVMTELQERITHALQLRLADTFQRELQPLRNEMTEMRQAVVDQSKHVGDLTDLVGKSTAYMTRVSAANKRNSQQLIAMRDQFNLMFKPTDQTTVASQDDPFMDAEDYDPAFPSDTQVGEPTPPGLESPANDMLP